MTDISIIKLWFQKAVPEPTDKNRAVQLGCHFEEVAEMYDALGEVDYRDDAEHLATIYKNFTVAVFEDINRSELLDALCDQIVTAVGVAHMFGLDITKGLEEVNRSNWSKFVDGNPVFDENGKIKKGPNYSPPDLSKFV